MRSSERRTAVRFTFEIIPHFHSERRAASSVVAHLGFVRPMKTTLFIMLLLHMFMKPVFAQYEVRKSADGFSIISKVRGRTYSVDVPGKDIKTYGANSADHRRRLSCSR